MGLTTFDESRKSHQRKWLSKKPQMQGAGPEEYCVHTVRRSDEGCSATQQLGSFCDAITFTSTGTGGTQLLFKLPLNLANFKTQWLYKKLSLSQQKTPFDSAQGAIAGTVPLYLVDS
jgi:hypothetical protein